MKTLSDMMMDYRMQYIHLQMIKSRRKKENKERKDTDFHTEHPQNIQIFMSTTKLIHD